MNDLERYHDRLIEQRPANFEMPLESGGQPTSNLIIGILRRWYIVLLVFFVMCSIGIPIIWFSIKPYYEVTGTIRVAPILANILTGEATRGEITNYQSFMNTQAEMVTRGQVIQRVADDLADRNLSFFENKATGLLTNGKQTLKNTKTKPEPADILKGAVSSGVIEAVADRRTELIRITMKSANPQEAEQIVNAFIRAYMAIESLRSIHGEDKKLTILENERRVLAGKLQRHRETIRQLAQEYGTVALDGRQDMMLQRVASLLAELTRIEARRINLEAQVQLLEQTKEQVIDPDDLLKMREEYISNDPMVNAITGNVAQLDQELIVAKQALTPTNPELQRKTQLLEALKARLEQHKEEANKSFDDLMTKELAKVGNQKLLNTKAELEQTKAYEKRLQEVLAKEDTQTIELGRKQLTIQDLQFQLDLDKEMYDTVCRRIREVEMERKRPARISVAYNAGTASIRDKRVKYTMALMFGAIACGMLLAHLRDKADLSLRTPDDVVKRIGIRIIGTTTSPHTIKRAYLPRQVAEDYRTIRANLGLLDDGGMPKKLVVTSPGMRDGKTTFAINLATSMSKSGKKVLLIDGDLRKPDIAHLLNLPNESRSLQDVLFEGKLDGGICSISLIGLDVLAADSRNAADAYELLASPQTAQRINVISQKYDHVIIDTPPVLAFPDALLWSKIADAAILISLAGQTTGPDLKEAKERLARIDVTVLGTVLSNVPVDHSYYRYRYNYYSQDGQRRGKTALADTKLLLPMQSKQNDSNDSDS